MVERQRKRSAAGVPRPSGHVGQAARLNVENVKSWFRGLLGNTVQESKDIARQGYQTPIETVFKVGGYIGTTVSVLFSIFGFFLGGSGTSASSNVSASFPFALRLGFYVLMSASIGWTVSTIGIKLTHHRSPWANIIARFGTVFAALFLATGIAWLFPNEILRTPGLVLGLGVAGSSLAVYLARTNYSLTYETNARVIAMRAELLMLFALGLSATLILQHLIGAT